MAGSVGRRVRFGAGQLPGVFEETDHIYSTENYLWSGVRCGGSPTKFDVFRCFLACQLRERMFGGAPLNAIGKLPFPASVVNTDAGNQTPKKCIGRHPLGPFGDMRS